MRAVNSSVALTERSLLETQEALLVVSIKITNHYYYISTLIDFQ